MVFDSVNKTEVSFATIILKKNEQIVLGNYSNQNGKAVISTNEVFDEIEISCIGYETKNIDKKNISDNTIVYLQPKSYQVEEVVISGTTLQTTGHLDEKSSFYKYIGTGETALFIENEFNKPVFIKSVLFKVKNVNIAFAYRIHFYRKTNLTYKVKESSKEFTQNIPDEHIEIPQVFILEPDTKGLVEINVSDYFVELPEDGIWVSIEPIGAINENEISRKRDNGLTIEFHLTKKENYCYKMFVGGWFNNNHILKRDFEVVFKKNPRKKDLIAPSFGLKTFI